MAGDVAESPPPLPTLPAPPVLPEKAPPPTGAVAARARLSKVQKVALAELEVSADLIRRGYRVFAQVARSVMPPDLVALDPRGKARRIELRAGVRREGRIEYATSRDQLADHLAIVVPGEPVTYRPPLK